MELGISVATSQKDSLCVWSPSHQVVPIKAVVTVHSHADCQSMSLLFQTCLSCGDNVVNVEINEEFDTPW